MATTMTTIGHRTRDANEVISFPLLTYSDAFPRDDLRDISNGIFQEDPRYVTKWKFPRPANGSNRMPPPGAGATFDFQLTVPPDDAIPSTAGSGRSPSGYMIGVALGSPRLLDDQEQPPPRFDTNIFTKQQGTQTPPKPSKWKKIGGLFKAKSALEAGPKASQQKIKKQLSTKQKEAPKKDSLEEWPKLEVDPPMKKAKKSTKKRRRFSISEKKNKEQNSEGPVLDVEIPNVEMERYSVMFRNVMDKNRTPSLLSRRSKTLDSLHVPSAEEFLRGKIPPVPQRRATSPASTNFSLFPTSQPPKAARVLGTQNFSRRQPVMTTTENTNENTPRAGSTERLRVPTTNDNQSSLHSPAPSNPFSTSERSTTPLSNPFLGKDEKPLPALRSDKPIQPHSRTASEGTIKRISKLQGQEAPSRPQLNIRTQGPAVPAKDSPSRSASPATSMRKSSSPREQLARTRSPATGSPLRTESPHVRTQGESKVKIPVIATEREISPKDISNRTSAVQLSTARSVSVSKGKKQMLVPVGSRIDQIHAHERYVDRRGALTPQISGGHKYQVSQELQIESV